MKTRREILRLTIGLSGAMLAFCALCWTEAQGAAPANAGRGVRVTLVNKTPYTMVVYHDQASITLKPGESTPVLTWTSGCVRYADQRISTKKRCRTFYSSGQYPIILAKYKGQYVNLWIDDPKK